ncbi:protein MAIN-LIKE 2-like [Lotus japonicus]|uniref:protein MAIN-LIKE 2-like n=1 Tax=Lotus japonicus TaxID=34305 RepID=UPI00258ED06C|nr:protein MAIN-LIKE 2-like [Lotus japonicus]
MIAMTMNEPLESIMEVRGDFMVSPAGDSEPTFRTAHFLKPIATSIDGTVSETLSSSMPPMLETEPRECPLKVHFNGWRSLRKNWNRWVDALCLRYAAVWKKVGIFEAIMSTKCSIVKNCDLAFGVAEKWCSKTNTFVFPWGEATITLEDVMVLGGYPVLGDPVFTSLPNQEMREVEEKLILARKEPWKSKQGKPRASAWIDTFMNSGSEMEHEAFLATWLSVFVFPHEYLVKKCLFPIAILLARGNPIALAPAVLASIYKDLGALKETIADLTKIPVAADKLDKELEVTPESPFYLVQIWLWERFLNLQPEPNVIKDGDPLLFRWHKVKGMKIDNVRLALNSAMGDFLWRPYVRYGGKCRAIYPENEIQQVPFEADLDKELASFVRCMRVSELVGIDSTIMQYCPHRVAMQFGMDQDVPDCVPVFRRTKGIAWENYCRPISDRNLYFPSRLFEADVTTRYAKWWK